MFVRREQLKIILQQLNLNNLCLILICQLRKVLQKQKIFSTCNSRLQEKYHPRNYTFSEKYLNIICFHFPAYVSDFERIPLMF